MTRGRRRSAKPVKTEADLAKAREGKEPPDSPQIVKRVKCPRCYTTDVKCDGTHDGVRHYRCRVCCDFDGGWTRFKVTIETGAVETESTP